MDSEKNAGSNIIRVKLLKQKKYGLGFLVRKRSRAPHVVVSDLVSHGMAAESGLVQIGDVILKVNDIDFEHLVYEKSVEILKNLPVNAPVVLVLRGPEGYTSYLETRFSQDGTPRTIRVTKPVLNNDTFIGRIRKTFSAGTTRPCRTKQTQANCECHISEDGKVGLVNGDLRREGNADEKSNSSGGSEGPVEHSTVANEAHISGPDLFPVNESEMSVSATQTTLHNKSVNSSNNNRVESSMYGKNSGSSKIVTFTYHDQSLNSKEREYTDVSGKLESASLRNNVMAHSCDVTRNFTAQEGDIKINGATTDDSVFVDSKVVQSGSGNQLKMAQEREANALVKSGQSLLNGSTAVRDSGGSRRGSHDVGKLNNGLLMDAAMERLGGASGKCSPVKKFVKLRHVGEERPVCTDTLHTKALEVCVHIVT